ncbi:MAG: DNA recombination protein RmuC [Alphaproteobacteria bacterium]|nr:DNA recombination protein RmuC [Alphaproteobacteria bacterium]
MLVILLSVSLLVCFFFLYKSSATLGRLGRVEEEVNLLRSEKENLQQKVLGFEKENELLKQDQQRLAQEKQNWQKEKELVLFQIADEITKKNSAQQNQIFENVTTKLKALDEEVKKSSDETNKIKAALLTPGGAGRTSEITLENILKASGLLERESFNSVGDYILQSHFGSDFGAEAKRPDAILFLPDNQIAVVDSKSSAHFFELAESEGEGEEKEILGKLRTMFRRHIEDLRRKDYASFLFEHLHAQNPSDYRIISVMFLQTEQMLEVLKKADRDFEQRAFEAGIIVATPVALIHLLSNVKFVVDRVKQQKNIELLKVEIGKLLDSFVVIVKESGELGRLINRALVGYNKLAKNLNRTTSLSKNISELGIAGKKSGEVKFLEVVEVDESQ